MPESKPEQIVRVIARILLTALDSATTAANGNPDCQAFIAELRDELKPDLDWMMRYGVIYGAGIDSSDAEDPTKDW